MPRLHPNPPRLITVGIAVALLIVGLALALPIPQIVDLLAALSGPLQTFGFALDRQFGYLCLFVSPVLLVIGSLLPGI
jgi:hypothetical protein